MIAPSVPAVVSGAHGGLAWAAAAVAVLATVPAASRWLRVAQREHYLAGSCGRFAVRWWTCRPVNAVLGALGLAGVLSAAAGAGVASPGVAAAASAAGALAAAVAAGLGPVGLSVRGRTAPLRWTRRLATLAATAAGVAVVVWAVGAGTGRPALAAAAAAMGAPWVVDLACALTAPLERRLAERFVHDAADRLARVAPTVVAVTGSYGKTSTKNHIRHLVEGSRSVVATPASFNNRAGLARAVNEHLADGTDIFVAEMGTYGPGEIAALCRWCPPAVSVITAVGPVHLERFGSEDAILAAKSEIVAGVPDAVLCVDDPRLAALADRLAASGTRVVRCSATDRSADVAVVRSDDGDGSGGRELAAHVVVVDSVEVAGPLVLPAGVQPANLACAVAVARVLGISSADVAPRLATLPAVDHRLAATRGQGGFDILDDTYNSNPAGASAALAALAATPARRRAVVTPGMVELGDRQTAENRAFGQAAAGAADLVVVVGRTNRRALMAGARAGGARPVGARRDGAGGPTVRWVADRPSAVALVREELGPGDAVLYENDLPDHYP